MINVKNAKCVASKWLGKLNTRDTERTIHIKWSWSCDWQIGVGRIENTCEKCDLDELEIDMWMTIRVGLAKAGWINWDEESLKLNSIGSNCVGHTKCGKSCLCLILEKFELYCFKKGMDLGEKNKFDHFSIEFSEALASSNQP
jgi:hypothetical protein